MENILGIGTFVIFLILIIGGILYSLAGTYSKLTYCCEQSGSLYLLNITNIDNYTISRISKGRIEFEEIETGTCFKIDNIYYTFTSKDNLIFRGKLKDNTISIARVIGDVDISSANFTKSNNTLSFLKTIFKVYQRK